VHRWVLYTSSYWRFWRFGYRKDRKVSEIITDTFRSSRYIPIPTSGLRSELGLLFDRLDGP
jgi:hypothetical protein